MVVEQISPELVEVTAGSVAVGPTIRVTDARSRRPLSDVAVEFRLRDGNGFIAGARTRTDPQGLATSGEWSVPLRTGLYTLEAFVGTSKTSFFTRVIAGAPDRLILDDTSMVGLVGAEFRRVSVRVLDRFGNFAPGASVTFSIVAGGGELADTNARTDNFGLVSLDGWRLGSAPGENAVAAAVDGIEPLRISVQAIDPQSVVWYILESIDTGLKLVSPQSQGIARSTLGLTTFDRCICRAEAGYYVIDVESTNPSLFLRWGRDGQYRLEDSRLRVLDSPWIGLFEGDRLHVYFDTDPINYEHWVFRLDRG